MFLRKPGTFGKPVALPRLIKYVLVGPGGVWFEMHNDKTVIEKLATRHPDCHVERWTYYEIEDGTHEIGFKEKV